MKKLVAAALAATLILGASQGFAGDKAQKRQRSKDGSGTNCQATTCPADCQRVCPGGRGQGSGKGKGQCTGDAQRKRDGSCQK